MCKDISTFFESIKTKKIAFIGMGVTNFDIIRMFLQKGLNVTVCDKCNRDAQLEKISVLEKEGASFCLGEHYLSNLTDFDVIFRSPGVYFNRPELLQARRDGVVVTSEMEVFFQFCPCKIIAITGSDGKTTTSSLIAAMLKEEGLRVHLGGNIGKALLPEIEAYQPDDYCVVELSSFQLLSMRQSPDIAVITNISPNHLDVHGTMEEYVQAKMNLLLHQDAFSTTVLNADNEQTALLSSMVRGKLRWFSRHLKQSRGAYVDSEGEIFFSNGENSYNIINCSQILLPGVHNVENYLTAIAAVGDLVKPAAIQKVARNFSGVAHRIEFVRQVHGVKWYNDSIATSPTRTIAGLHSFSQKLIIIAGGYDKKISYAPLAPHLIKRVKILILMGDTAKKIQQAVLSQPDYDQKKLPIFIVDSMEDAVKKAEQLATSGDIVSLSPASASFDAYQNFEKRGEHFKDLVMNIGEEN